MKEVYLKYINENGWIIKEDKWVKQLQGIRESQFAIGNGYMGSRAILEEIPSGSTAGTYIAGIYDKLTSQVTEMVNLPNPYNFKITTNGEKVDVFAMEVEEHSRVLNMNKGLLLRHTVFSDSKKRRYDLQSMRLASMSDKNIGVMQVSITALDSDAQAVIFTGIDTSVENSGVLTEGSKRHFKVKELGQEDSSGYLLIETYEKKYRILYRAGFYYQYEGKKIEAKDNILTLNLKKGQTVTFTKVFFMCHLLKDEPAEGVKKESLKKFRKAFKSSLQSLINDHVNAFSLLWQRADIQILGTANLQTNLRFNIYHLLISATDDKGFSSIGAKTMTGEGYRGHIFWDTELFLLPFYTFTFPKIARSLLLYRYNRLDAARKIARQKGYRGAMFPWESADTGDEETPTWAKDLDGSIIKIKTDKLEHHISADIAYAYYRYYLATYDQDFMNDYGYEVIFETARFWASRVEFNKGRNVYEIKNVIGPDEFHEHVDNNAFTNMMARWNLSTAARLAQNIKENNSEIYKQVSLKIKLTEKEVIEWKNISHKIRFNIRKDGVIEQFDGFFKLKKYAWEKTDENGLPLLPKSFKARRLKDYQLVKQADVLMLFIMFPDLFSDKIKEINYRLYVPKTLHKSSLSPSMHSVVASEVKDLEAAYRLFNVSLRCDISNLYNNTQIGIHSATLGGTWQALIRGFCGTHIRRDMLSVSPFLPLTWKKIIFSLEWRGDMVYFDMKNSRVKIHVISSKKKKLPIEIFGHIYHLLTNREYVFERPVSPVEKQFY